MVKNDLLRKLIVYGGNFVVRPVGNLIQQGVNLGNPGAAIFYGFIDIFRNATPKFKESKYIRLIEAVGFSVYTAKTITNLVSIAKGDFEYLIDIPFNASMAFEIGKNTIYDYKGKNLKNDLIGIPKDILGIPTSAEKIYNSIKYKKPKSA